MKIITTLLFTTVLSIGNAFAGMYDFDEGRQDLPIRFEIMNEFLKGNPPSVNELKILHKQHDLMKHNFSYRAGACYFLINTVGKLSTSGFQILTTLETNFERGPMVTIVEGDDNLTVHDIRAYFSRCLETVDVFMRKYVN